MNAGEPLSAEALLAGWRGTPVVRGVDLALRPGELTVLLGANGAGKSTLLACLAGLKSPEAGAVRLGSRTLRGLGAEERARRIAYLPQFPEIAWRLPLSVYVELGRTARRSGRGETDAAAVRAALGATGLSALAGRDVLTLSGGERARAHLARALAGEPEWILADEPFAGLDPPHQIGAAEVLRAFAESGGGALVSVHDLSFAARVADRVLLLADGRLLADAPPREALRPDRILAAYGLRARWIEGEGGPVLDVLGRAAS